MRSFEYPCPDCRVTNNLHASDCPYADRSRGEIEYVYSEILGALTLAARSRAGLQNAVNGWTDLHGDCLTRLEIEHIIRQDGDVYVLLSPEERRDALSDPTYEPLKTIYEKGSVPGCHDNAVFAMVAFYEMIGLSWEETREQTIEWLHESGAWDRGGFEEKSPEELVEQKRHVYDEGYGWREKAEAAKQVIDQTISDA